MELSHTHHVLLFPFPAKGHIKPFFSLAQLLCNAGLRVTFLNTDHHHRRIHDLNRLAAQLPTLHFDSVSDGLPPDEPRDVPDRKLCDSIRQVTSSLFRELLVSYNNGSSSGRPPITCVITDVMFRFPIDIAEELGIPVFTFSTFSARFLFLIFWIPKLLEHGQLQYPEQELHGVPGAEGLIRWKDLPGFWSVEDVADWDPMNFVNETLATSRSSGLILNSFDELEAPFLTSLSKIYKKIYSLGPINSLLKNIQSQPQYNLWKEDHSCMAWLDSQPRKSVVFVSFGSVVKLTSRQLMEFWNGLVNSGKPFLLVLRSDVTEAGEEVVREIMERKAEGRWVIVNWAPQEEVLAHDAVGGFLTHSGWNSTLESLAAGVPMISWPQIGDQTSNSTWVSKVWRIGLQLEDGFDSSTIETMVRSIMDQKMEKTVAELAERAKNRASKNGTSYRNFQTLIQDITNIIETHI
ncbi:7-deoxyloganetic acid glucosyltransferase-like isoform X1 [Cucurbita pepo subsp. pepo]|uniref:7-deoxyloganetic acid glucosyltransferase-like isoform X1 n=1 Tax=Cucurbita pepo subsp. pepo TaxID=3664 RepID=UPI000C9D420E|nr:7-deoxyloganetic acid glucosyltransferase-like isoform X1 [Cucurbita pepo subsp. pepo]